MSGLLIPPHAVFDRARREMEAFHDLRWVQLSELPDYLRLNPGANPDQWALTALREMGRGMPEVRHVLPVPDSTLEAYKRGDPSVLRALGEELMDSHTRFVETRGIQ